MRKETNRTKNYKEEDKTRQDRGVNRRGRKQTVPLITDGKILKN
jgi:hypothetical protein